MFPIFGKTDPILISSACQLTRSPLIHLFLIVFQFHVLFRELGHAHQHNILNNFILMILFHIENRDFVIMRDSLKDTRNKVGFQQDEGSFFKSLNFLCSGRFSIEKFEVTAIKCLVIPTLGLYLIVFEPTFLNIFSKSILLHMIAENIILAFEL